MPINIFSLPLPLLSKFCIYMPIGVATSGVITIKRGRTEA